MAKSETSRLTANDLPSQVVKEHRVMFVRGGKDGGMTVVTDQMRAGLDGLLSVQLKFPVNVIALADASDEVREAFPTVMAMVADTKLAVRDTLTPSSKTPARGSSRKKRGERQPE